MNEKNIRRLKSIGFRLRSFNTVNHSNNFVSFETDANIHNWDLLERNLEMQHS